MKLQNFHCVRELRQLKKEALILNQFVNMSICLQNRCQSLQWTYNLCLTQRVIKRNYQRISCFAIKNQF